MLSSYAASNSFEALMIAIAYPKTSLVDIISEMRTNQVSEDEILKAAQLVGAYLGKLGIRARS